MWAGYKNGSRKRQGIGPWSRNLIPVKEDQSEFSKEEQAGVREIRVTEILPNPHQPRKQFSDQSIQELSNTIVEHGVIQPIVVQKNPSGSGFVLVAWSNVGYAPVSWQVSQRFLQLFEIFLKLI